MAEKCGHHNMHWYQDGDSCQCGQIPKEIFFSAGCSCGACRDKKPIHEPDCSQIQWAEKRNHWISEHPDINPPLGRVCYRVKEEAMVSHKQRCITNCKSTANMELYQKIADFGNEKLRHMWNFTVDDVLKVMQAVILYCIENGEVPEDKKLDDIMLRTLGWHEADGAIKIITHTI